MKTPHYKLAQVAALALVLTSLVGCGSSAPKQPVNLAAVTGAPGTKTGAATITFYRPRDLVGVAFNTSVWLDKIDIADLDPGTFVLVKASPGSHKIHCDENGDSLPVNLEAGKNYFVRVKVVPGAGKGAGVLPDYFPVNVDLEVGKSYFFKVKLCHGVLLPVDNASGMKEFAGEKLSASKAIKQPSLVLQGMPQS
jgi:hypothetical protein